MPNFALKKIIGDWVNSELKLKQKRLEKELKQQRTMDTEIAEKMDKRMRDAKREANDAEQAVEHKDEQIGDFCEQMTKLEKKLKAVKEALKAVEARIEELRATREGCMEMPCQVKCKVRA